MGYAAAPVLLTWLLSAGCSRDPHAAMMKYVKSGDQFAAAGKTPEAIIEYRNALDNDPRAGDVRIKLADAYLRNGEAAKGIQEYVRAADSLPDAQVQLKTGNLLLLARRFDDAKGRAERVLAGDARNVEAQILLANALAGLKDLDGAVAQLEEAVRLNPDRSTTYTNLGQIQLERGRRDAAEQAFRRAVELAPKSGLARLSLANFYWMTARLPDAESELKAALQSEPDSPLVRRTAATFYLSTGRRDEAEPHLRRVVELTNTPAASLMLADYYVAQKREADARRILEPLVAAPPSAVDANVRLAVLDRASGNAGEATKRLDRVLATDAKNLQALLLRSSFLLSEGKPEDALKAAQAAVESHPDAASAFFTLGRVQAARREKDQAIAAYEQTVRLNPRAGEAKVAIARLQLADGNLDSSVAMAQEALSAQPQNADARLALVQGLIRRGDLARAQTELDILKTRFPDSPAVHGQLGLLMGRKGDLTGARAEFERALELQPTSLEAVGGLVALDLSARQIPAARARVDKLVSAPTASPSALMLAARTYAAAGDHSLAEQMLRRVLAADPSHLPAYGALGQLYARQGRLDAALAEFDALAQRDTKPVAALTLAGMILESQGKTAAAQQTFERVLQLDPRAPVAANNLAWMYAQNGGNLDVALQLAQTAKSKLPDMADVSDTLGFIYFKKGLLTQAVAELTSAVGQDAANPGFHYHLGLALAAQGNKATASEHLTRALALKPDFEGAADARAVLKTLGT